MPNDGAVRIFAARQREQHPRLARAGSSANIPSPLGPPCLDRLTMTRRVKRPALHLGFGGLVPLLATTLDTPARAAIASM
jgi:hypothetical protein